jgi:choline dehydrogenase-like flavoprotein
VTDRPTTDVLIIGSGIMGATVARLLREAEPTLTITMVDGGHVIGDTPGLHLHDVPDPVLWSRYNERVASGIQGLYTGAQVVRDVADHVRELPPGMYHAHTFGQDAAAMPASALAWNAGGMGVHWTAATPWPAGDEVFHTGEPASWAEELDTARRILQVVPAAIGPTEPGRRVLDTLRHRYAGTGPDERMPQPMPMAVRPTASGPMPRTGPSTIFPPIGSGRDPAFALRMGTLAAALLVDGARVRGARLREIATGAESLVTAATTIVCADAIRTPQLLFASGIRPKALGRYLNEHAFISGRVLMNLDRFGLSPERLPLPRAGEFCTDSLWLPQNGPDQPFHGQFMNTTYVDDAGRPLAYSVGISLYVPVESREINRLVFSETETDVAGMPRVAFEFAYSKRDLGLIARAECELQAIAEEFGPFDPATERALLPPGSSLHHTGTVRMGTVDDGRSVTDPHGRVWGFENLYLAGNGVVPTALAANATLTGTITAVRAARAVVGTPALR